MEKLYKRTYWKNAPDKTTPVNAENLDNIEAGIDELDNRVVELKSDLSKETSRAIAKENELEELFTLPTEEAVSKWLDEHPEATTTVQDNSLVEDKFTEELRKKTLKDYVTPQMFGAVGDGKTDDTNALNLCFASGKPVHLVSNYRTTNTLNLYNELIGNNFIIFAEHDNDIIVLHDRARIEDLQINTTTTKKAVIIRDGVRRLQNIMNKVTLYSSTRTGTGIYIEMNDNSYFAYNNMNDIIIFNFGIGIHLNAVGTGFIQCNNFNNVVNSAKQFILEEGNETNGNLYNISCEGSDDNVRSVTKGIIKSFIIDCFSQTFEIKDRGGFEGFTDTLGVKLNPKTPKVYFNGFMQGNGGYIKNIAGTSLDVFDGGALHSTVGKGYFKYEDHFIGNAISPLYTITDTVAVERWGTQRNTKRRENGLRLKLGENVTGSLLLENTGVTADKYPTFEMIICDRYGNDASGLDANHIETGVLIQTNFMGFSYNHDSSSPAPLMFINPFTGETTQVANVKGELMTIGNAMKLLYRMRFYEGAILVEGTVEDYNNIISIDANKTYGQYKDRTFSFVVEQELTNEKVEPVVNLKKYRSQVIIEYLKVESTKIPCY